MNKKYIIPTIKVKKVKPVILAGSNGVKSNSTLGNEYTSTDESYSKQSFVSFIGGWDAEE